MVKEGIFEEETTNESQMIKSALQRKDYFFKEGYLIESQVTEMKREKEKREKDRKRQRAHPSSDSLPSWPQFVELG